MIHQPRPESFRGGAVVEKSDGLCHIQEGFIPTDILISLSFILPRLSSRGESIRKTLGLQSNLLLFAATDKVICQKNHPCSWKGAKRRDNPVITLRMRRAWIATSRQVGIRDDESSLFEDENRPGESNRQMGRFTQPSVFFCSPRRFAEFAGLSPRYFLSARLTKRCDQRPAAPMVSSP